MDRVFTTVELLELILLAVDVQTLLTSASRVCQQWNNVIQQSVQLQTALFFRPEKPHGQGQHQQLHARVNPLLVPYFNHLLRSPSDTGHSFPNQEILLRPEASWRRMLIQQPPVRKLGLWKIGMGHSLQDGFKCTTETIHFEGPEGALMGDLVTYAASRKQRYSWDLYSGQEGRKRLDREKRSLLVLKSSVADQQALFTLWKESDMVAKITRWLLVS